MSEEKPYSLPKYQGPRGASDPLLDLFLEDEKDGIAREALIAEQQYSTSAFIEISPAAAPMRSINYKPEIQESLKQQALSLNMPDFFNEQDRTVKIPMRMMQLNTFSHVDKMRNLTSQTDYLQKIAQEYKSGDKTSTVNLMIAILNRTLDSNPKDLGFILNSLTNTMMDQSENPAEIFFNYESYFMLSILKTILFFANNPSRTSWISAKQNLFEQVHDQAIDLHALQHFIARLEEQKSNGEAVVSLREYIPKSVSPFYRELILQGVLAEKVFGFKPSIESKNWQLRFQTEDYHIYSKPEMSAIVFNFGLISGIYYYYRNVLVFGTLHFGTMFNEFTVSEEELNQILLANRNKTDYTLDMVIVTDTSATFPTAFSHNHLIHVVKLTDSIIKNEKAFEAKYKELLQMGYRHIFSLHMKSIVSSTFECAQNAAQRVFPERIRVFDTRAYSIGLGLMIQTVAEEIFKQETQYHIEQTIYECINSHKQWLLLNSMDHIRKRVKINPKLNDGKTDFLHFKPVLAIGKQPVVIGCYVSFNNGREAMLKSLLDEHDKRTRANQPIHRIAIEYKGLFVQALTLLKLLKSRFPDMDIQIYEATPYTTELYGNELIGISVI